MAADRKLGCLSICLFLALCASAFLNFFLLIAFFQRAAGGGMAEREMLPRFREITIERGHGGKIAARTRQPGHRAREQ